MAGGVIEFELVGRAQRFKKVYFDETLMLKLNTSAREVVLHRNGAGR